MYDSKKTAHRKGTPFSYDVPITPFRMSPQFSSSLLSRRLLFSERDEDFDNIRF